MRIPIRNLPSLARLLALVLLSTLTPSFSILALGTAFTCQGSLAYGGAPAIAPKVQWPARSLTWRANMFGLSGKKPTPQKIADFTSLCTDRNSQSAQHENTCSKAHLSRWSASGVSLFRLNAATFFGPVPSLSSRDIPAGLYVSSGKPPYLSTFMV